MCTFHYPVNINLTSSCTLLISYVSVYGREYLDQGERKEQEGKENCIMGNNFYSSTYKIRVIKSRRMTCAENVTLIGG
jgi:hypothetical protein